MSIIAVLKERTVVRVTGEDPRAFLHATTTQDILAVKAGAGTLTCLLNGKGGILAEGRALVMADGSVLIDAEPAARAALTGWLAGVAGLSGCAVTDESDAWTVTAFRGEGAGSIDTPVPEDENDHVEDGNRIVVRTLWGGAGFDVLTRDDGTAPGTSEATEALEALRIADGRTRFGIDIPDGMLINETPLLERAVSFGKGCFPGQETVARVRNLGQVRHAFVALTLGSGTKPALGAAVRDQTGEIGKITSAARAENDDVVAIAYVRAGLDQVEPVTVGGASARLRNLA